MTVPQPTPADLALDLAKHLKDLLEIKGDLYRGFYCVEHHRAAIRRAIAAEAEVGRLRAEIEAKGAGQC